jgi:replicative DNA helicase
MANNAPNYKIPPQSSESEMAVLGAIMVRPDAIHEIIDIVRPHAFYADRHRLIYETMLELHSSGKPIDILSLANRLKEKKMLDQVGGKSYIVELSESVPSSANVKHYGEIVQKKSLMRGLIKASETIGQLGYDEMRHIDELMDEAEKRIFEVTNISTTQSFVPIKDSLAETWDRIERLSNSDGGLRGVPTGFKALDNKLAGLQASDLIILAARPSVGKTSFALELARQAAVNHGIPVGIFSLEMGAQQLIDRMLSSQARIDLWRLRTGKVKDADDFDRIRDALDILSKAPIYIDDEPGKTVLSMRAVARRLKSEKNLGLIIVDYLQLATPSLTRASDNMVQQVTEISRSLKGLARELNVPVLALSQLSRAVESRGGKPRLSDLRDSGSIEQDADVVMFIHREDKGKDESERTNIAEILIEKHRNGPTGRVELFFDAEHASFRDLDTSEYGSGISDF